MIRISSSLVLLLINGACAGTGASSTGQAPGPADSLSVDRAQYVSTYRPHPHPAILIRNATIMTATGAELANASILLRAGKIVAVGRDLTAGDATVIDGTGKFVTPGLIDAHSHLGVYAAPGTFAEQEGNEMTSPVTSEVWAEHAFWPQDPQIPLAIAGGVTVIQALPGSANLFGGRSATLRLVPARSVQEMKFPGAPYGLKMACGENIRRTYGNSGGPMTRMGNFARYRTAWIEADEYRRRWDKWLANRAGDAPTRNLELETLADVLRGRILVQNHCYRADEMVQMIDLAREFGYHIRSFHHAVEAYKIADILAREGIASSIWADWWGFKMESFDGIPENAALLQNAGARVVIHSDDANGTQRLNHEAAKSLYAGIQAGLPVNREQAIRWITANPAWVLGIDSVTGTLEPGKSADVVIWSGDPFSIYSKAEQVFNDGWLVFDRGRKLPRTDFNLGIDDPGVGQ